MLWSNVGAVSTLSNMASLMAGGGKSLPRPPSPKVFMALGAVVLAAGLVAHLAGIDLHSLHTGAETTKELGMWLAVSGGVVATGGLLALGAKKTQMPKKTQQSQTARELGYSGAYDKYAVRAKALSDSLMKKDVGISMDVNHVNVKTDGDPNDAIRLFFNQAEGNTEDSTHLMILYLPEEKRKALFAHATALRNSSAPIPKDVEKHLQVIDRLINKLETDKGLIKAEKVAQFAVVQNYAPEANDDPQSGYVSVVNKPQANGYLAELEKKPFISELQDFEIPKLDKDGSPEDRLQNFMKAVAENGKNAQPQKYGKNGEALPKAELGAADLEVLVHYAILKMPQEERDLLLREAVYLRAKCESTEGMMNGVLGFHLASFEQLMDTIVHYKEQT